MRNRFFKIFILFLFAGFVSAQKDSAYISFNGQLTAWEIAQVKNPVPVQFGGRFVPTILGDFKLSSVSKIDVEASLNINGAS